MSTRLVYVAVRAQRPRALAEFWAGLLGWTVTLDRADRVDIAPPDPGLPGPALTFRPGPPDATAHTTPNRLHLDLASHGPRQQEARVRRALDLGGRHLDIGQGAVPWVVLADPEGNEFCVLEPRPEYAGTGALAAVVVGAAAPARLAAFWSAASGWPIVREGTVAGLRSPTELGSWLEFIPHPGPGDDRLHLELGTRTPSTAAERLTAAGAVPRPGPNPCGGTRFTDPGHNPFCLVDAERGQPTN
ncbi:VOC family protein [Nocardia harenae]|uniref:VOC family protein n=1 Tax=Nocardia harenae TaxID=358707 RepID=UPI00082F8A5B|nr:VOC family protein [Nocardia harenae]